MIGIVEVLLQNILPIFLVAGLGFWLRRSRGLDTRMLSSVVFNAFSPALVFVSLVTTDLPAGELARMVLFTIVTVLVMGLVGVVGGRLLRLDRQEAIVLVMALMFVNSGNYGLTLNQLRFGDPGLSRAVVFYMVSTIMVYTLGVFVASMGRTDWRLSLKRLARVPAIYAVILGFIVYFAGLQVPAPLMRAVEIAAEGAIPLLLVVLGMNLAGLSGERPSLRLTVPAVSLRLLLAPLVALLLAGWLGLQGLARSTMVIEASMPTAVITTVLATEFQVLPGSMTSIVALSTLLSPLTLALFINLLAL